MSLVKIERSIPSVINIPWTEFVKLLDGTYQTLSYNHEEQGTSHYRVVTEKSAGFYYECYLDRNDPSDALNVAAFESNYRDAPKRRSGYAPARSFMHKLSETNINGTYSEIFSFDSSESRNVVYGVMVAMNTAKAEIRISADDEILLEVNVGNDQELLHGKWLQEVARDTYAVEFPREVSFINSFKLEIRTTDNKSKKVERGMVTYARI